MYKDTITLFIRQEGDEGDTWHPTIIPNVHLNMDRAAIMAKYGAEAADSAELHLRYTQEGNEKRIAEKVWKPPKEWEKLLDKTGAITFTPGDRFDFFWLGNWDREAPVHDSDFTVISFTGFYNFMNRNFDHVFAITSVGGPYSVIPHFEILGK